MPLNFLFNLTNKINKKSARTFSFNYYYFYSQEVFSMAVNNAVNLRKFVLCAVHRRTLSYSVWSLVHIKYTAFCTNITLWFHHPMLASSSMHVWVCVHLWVWMQLWEGASEEKGSCGMKLKAFDTVQLCRTPTTEERLNECTEVWQWDNDRKTGRWTSRQKTQNCPEKLKVRADLTSMWS